MRVCVLVLVFERLFALGTLYRTRNQQTLIFGFMCFTEHSESIWDSVAVAAAATTTHLMRVVRPTSLLIHNQKV